MAAAPDRNTDLERAVRRENLTVTAIIIATIVTIIGFSAWTVIDHVQTVEARAAFLAMVEDECRIEFGEDTDRFTLARHGSSESTTAVNRRGDLLTLTATTVNGELRIYTADDPSPLCVLDMANPK